MLYSSLRVFIRGVESSGSGVGGGAGGICSTGIAIEFLRRPNRFIIYILKIQYYDGVGYTEHPEYASVPIIEFVAATRAYVYPANPESFRIS